MNAKKQQKQKKRTVWIVAVAVTLAVLVGGGAIYVSDYYRADTEAIAAFAMGREVLKTEISDGVLAFGDTDADTGFLFYPGGKVEYTAYEPLMRELARRGALCILIEMPFNLAVLDANAADGLCEQFPSVTQWYVGGHSLGGSMAAYYVSEHTDRFAGLVLLGSYSTEDLSGSALSVLSVYGSEDGVMNREKYEAYRSCLPAKTTEIVIEGGCHAYFGMYGAQDGDGTPTLTAEEQILRTAAHISDFFAGGAR